MSSILGCFLRNRGFSVNLLLLADQKIQRGSCLFRSRRPAQGQLERPLDLGTGIITGLTDETLGEIPGLLLDELAV